MAGRRTVAAVLAGAVASALLVGGSVSRAGADEPQAQRVAVSKAKITTRTAPDLQTAGYAVSRVTITWKSARKAVVRGWVKDKCPADGNEAHVLLYNQQARKFTFVDRRGCDADGRRSFYATVRAPKGKNLTVVYVNVFEYDVSLGRYTDGKGKTFANKLL